jgi:hypothetical protein
VGGLCGEWSTEMTTRHGRVGSTPDVRGRLAIFHGSSVGAEEALGLEDSAITFDLLMRHGVKAVNLMAAGVGPTSLKARGAHAPQQLRQLGFDALHLCDPDFCNEASMAYGARPVASAFLATANDAVALAGTEAMHILDLQSKDLLAHCAGFPGEAVAVLQQLTPGTSLQDVPATLLLDAGLRAGSLKQCGYGLAGVVTQVDPTGLELSKLGYSM